VDAPQLRDRLARFPRLGLARLPTPLDPLDRLTAHARGPRLWIKREDMGDGSGGNKLRKLDYVLPEAIAAGADVLVSGGVVQSNSQRQVAAAAARLGLACHLAIHHGRVEPPGADYDVSGNALLTALFGAVIHPVAWTGDRNRAIGELRDELSAAGHRPFVVPYGVSSATGALAYAEAAAEIAEQCAARGFAPAAIVHCSGSGATQAGLAVGAALCLPATRVLGIDIDAEPERVRADVVALARQASALLEVEIPDGAIEVIAGHAGPGYGVPDRSTIDAIKLAARLEALLLDPVYTGKAMAGLLALVRAGRWRPDDNVVFVHTGGAPALFAYRESLGL
jgi:L-cysteate sulfo-lyase